MKKYRLTHKSAYAAFILLIERIDGCLSFQVVTGDEDQSNSVMIGCAQLVEAIMADPDGEYAHVHVVRLHLFDAEHVGIDAADPVDARLLALFPCAPYYVLGEGAEVYSVATGKVAGYLPEKAA